MEPVQMKALCTQKGIGLSLSDLCVSVVKKHRGHKNWQKNAFTQCGASLRVA
jgi:hypothetical protein